MPANNKVSVAWQIVFTFLPIVNFWAFYRIRKLRRYLLYVILPSIVVSSIYLSYSGLWLPLPLESISPGHSTALMNGTEMVPAFYDEVMYASLLNNSIGLGLQGLAVYLVIIWSRHHNRRADASKGQSPPNT